MIKGFTINSQLTLVTDNQSSLPLWSDVHSGNSNDREIIPSVIKQFEVLRKSISIDREFIYVADSALFSKKHLLSKSTNFYWITRVPESLSNARKLIERDKKYFDWTVLDSRFKVASFSHAHGGVKQRWLVVQCRKAYFKEVSTLEKNIEKEWTYLFKKAKKFKRTLYHCDQEAINEVDRLRKNHPLFEISQEIEKKVVSQVVGGKRRRRTK
ncbi:MAG: IS1634 family transposase, partial [bacterium]|nr:IS1634 family transposase [bacterium]